MDNSMYSFLIKQLGKLFGTDKMYNMEDVIFAQGLKKQLIYPTDNTLLLREQFAALTGIISPDERVYILSDGYNSALEEPKPAGRNTFFSIREIPHPFDYEEYTKLASSDMIIIFSDSFRWVMVLSELRDDGLAILAGEEEILGKFGSLYPNAVTDLINFTEYCIDLRLNENFSIDSLKIILNIIK
ncbi:MAG: hypothetical protein E7218_00820 [Anaerofustis stercorihominis]|nr:hypothetical protein [Anaerofustis stercorihominis]